MGGVAVSIFFRSLTRARDNTQNSQFQAGLGLSSLFQAGLGLNSLFQAGRPAADASGSEKKIWPRKKMLQKNLVSLKSLNFLFPGWSGVFQASTSPEPAVFQAGLFASLQY